MYLFNQNLEKIQYKEENLIGTGSTSNVYKINDNRCIKVLNNKYEFNIEILDIIKNMQLENYYKIYNYLYNKNKKIKGYEIEYYKKSNINILNTSSEYTTYNFIRLYKSILKLSKENIFVSDLHTDNVIVTDNEIVVIDTDDYGKSVLYGKEELQERNIKTLLTLFANLYIESLSHDLDISEILYLTKKIQCTFDSKNINETVNNIPKTLTKYKTPLQYLKYHI